MQWKWPTLGDAKLAAVLLTPLSALESYLRWHERNRPVQSVIRTTDATVTTLATIQIPVNYTVQVRGEVVSRRTGGSSGATNDGAGYVLEMVAKNTAGTAALIAAATVRVTGEDQAAWAVTVDASGNSIRVRVTGAANNNITWAWSGQSLAVKE